MTTKTNVRKQTRAVAREATYLGRDGKPLVRKVEDTVNPFEVPLEHRQEDWDYQWVRNSCFGKRDDANLSKMFDAGWRPVEHQQMPGFMKGGRSDLNGAIEHEGLTLMERPMGMTLDAREEHAIANRLLERQQYQKFDMAPPVGSRFEARNDQRLVRKGRPEAVDVDTYPERKRRVSEGANID
jgi:hypothetical protein